MSTLTMTLGSADVDFILKGVLCRLITCPPTPTPGCLVNLYQAAVFSINYIILLTTLPRSMPERGRFLVGWTIKPIGNGKRCFIVF